MIRSAHLPLINALLAEGIEITLSQVNGVTNYNLNTQAKSQVVLTYKRGVWTAHMRYDETYTVNSVEDVVSRVAYGRHGRDYINAAWADVIQKYGPF